MRGRCLAVLVLALALFVAGCGRYGPPVRPRHAEPEPMTETGAEEEPEERSTDELP